MQATQLTLFEIPQKIEPIYNEYFRNHFGWIPKVGKLARIDTTLAIANLYHAEKRYCSGAEVIVMEIIGDECLCETTDEWVKAVSLAQSKEETKDLFRVKLRDLGMIFN